MLIKRKKKHKLSLTMSNLPDNDIIIWCSGTTSTCTIGFLEKFLFDLFKVISDLYCSSWEGMLYISKWPCCVPTITFPSENIIINI